MRSDRERLLDILEAIERIEKYAKQGKEAFAKSDLIQNWMIRYIQIIGEAAARLTEATRSANPDVPWTEIVGMRNILVHQYFGIDIEAVWNAVEKNLPALKTQIERMLRELNA